MQPASRSSRRQNTAASERARPARRRGARRGGNARQQQLEADVRAVTQRDPGAEHEEPDQQQPRRALTNEIEKLKT